ncbi:CAP domain-containing protein [Metaclostridioides mangenotii]|uniref:Uncharacterized protein YkwD n=1 Tax=Metaclostridioides mangenotii TaxID=1540 RepID=A0ABS4E8U4_9FIRM|nr:CAP-associated domain-containing protein [Clostridioides mangenotii]MBP1854346.1 uncharacterized protein YkwD [Clostridioides mangenotii]
MKKLITVILVIAIFIFYDQDIVNQLINLDTVDKTKQEQSVVQDEHVNQQTDTSIDNFYNLQIGDSEKTLINAIGDPARVDKSEYDFNWYVYNQFEAKFCMVGVENEKIVALYSNSIDSKEIKNIKINGNKNLIREVYTPLKRIKKGNTNYVINSKEQYDIVEIGDKYVTVFYDIYEGNRITSYEVVTKQVEDKIALFPKESGELRKSYELEIIDMVNSVRQQRNLKSLDYSQKATISSRKHCKDMKVNKFFDHINKKGKGPGDRMKAEGIIFTLAGENIAAGQFNSIYAHEAWMNSEGHRKNILGEYKYIGVGVEFGGSYNMYYGQNFYK